MYRLFAASILYPVVVTQKPREAICPGFFISNSNFKPELVYQSFGI